MTHLWVQCLALLSSQSGTGKLQGCTRVYLCRTEYGLSWSGYTCIHESGTFLNTSILGLCTTTMKPSLHAHLGSQFQHILWATHGNCSVDWRDSRKLYLWLQHIQCSIASLDIRWQEIARSALRPSLEICNFWCPDSKTLNFADQTGLIVLGIVIATSLSPHY